jgi:hypothetical protein
VPGTVTDATSGPASSTVSAAPDISSSGPKAIVLTGEDNAGNSSVVQCPYLVLGHVDNLMSWNFTPFAAYTVVTELTAYDVPEGARITIFCSRRRCPFRTRTISVGGGTRCTSRHCHKSSRRHTKTVDLTGLFRRQQLAKGTRVEVTVTQRYAIGKVWIFTMRSNRQPAKVVTCLAPGSSAPARGC